MCDFGLLYYDNVGKNKELYLSVILLKQMGNRIKLNIGLKVTIWQIAFVTVKILNSYD